LAPGEFAFLLRVGGELVLRDIEKEWNAHAAPSNAASAAVSKYPPGAITRPAHAHMPSIENETNTILVEHGPRPGKRTFSNQAANEDFFTNTFLRNRSDVLEIVAEAVGTTHETHKKSTLVRSANMATLDRSRPAKDNETRRALLANLSAEMARSKQIIATSKKLMAKSRKPTDQVYA
jgi:hypothetical protein